jgi:nickel transport protein
MRVRLLTLIVCAACSSPALAHRLDAQAFLLPDRKVRVESWFSSGEIPKRASVSVYRQNDELLQEGKLDDQGTWTFSFPQAEPLRIVINAGAGHRKELTIDAGDLTAETNPPSIPLPDRHSGSTLKDVTTGIAFLLALAAFILAIRNGRRLRSLEKRR